MLSGVPAHSDEEFSVGLRWVWGLPTSSRAWWAFVASASSEEPGWVLFRMFYRTNSRQGSVERRDRKQEEVIRRELMKKSRNKILTASHSEKEGCGQWEDCSHHPQGMEE